MSARLRPSGPGRNPPRVYIRCIICGREARVPASHVRPPRSNVHLCGKKPCHSAWKMAVANAFSMEGAANG